MSEYRQATLRVNGYFFDTWAIKRAYTRLEPTFISEISDYDEQALSTLLELFCDWSPARIYDSPSDVYSALNTDPANSLSALNEDEKRDLYQNVCADVAHVLREDYDIDATDADVKRFAKTLTVDETSEELADFLLEFLTEYSKYLATFDPDQDEVATDAPLQEFLNGIRDLPEEYLDAKHTQYEGHPKVRGIRHRVADTFLSGNELSVSQFHELCEEENARHDTAILTGYSPYSILGQLYYDYAKLRIDRYLDRLTAYFADELDIQNHARHTCNFVEPRNQLTQFTWIALHPGDEDTKDEYQLYLGIRPTNLRYGLYAGTNLYDGDEWEDRDLETRELSESYSIGDVVDKLDAVKDEYMVLNERRDDPEPVDSPEDHFKPPNDADTLVRQLEQNGQLVFYGPPGTGKTYTAEQFAKWWTSEGPTADDDVEQFRAVTFHPSFAYEDFLEGLSADATDEGMVEYDMDAGVFKAIAEDATEAYENTDSEDPPRFVLVIDEINRGNLAQIFGETITQLETDKRLDADNELTVHLAHSGKPFEVPPNLYIIGTMNTADRSIALVDAALRRRFRFMYFPPDYNALATHHGFDDWDAVNSTAEAGPQRDRVLLALSIDALETINSRILDRADLGKGKQIGHSYLWNCATTDDVEANVQSLVDTWKYEILPLLEEYFFGQFERLQRDVFGDEADKLLDVDRRQIADFEEQDLRRALAAITDHAGEIRESATTNAGEQDSERTVDILSNAGVLEPGDVLEFNRGRLRNGSTIETETVDQARRDRPESFWRCEVTEDTTTTGEVQWQYDDEMYSVSAAARAVLTELTDGEIEDGQADHWMHPEYDDQNLYQLRKAVLDESEAVEHHG
ncbi:McrB family protein [Halorussus sp. AFM4]|uniref:McrB family protein n=1 Tax=Halorussus sp. AFM4 TaxID=3421651 RepID=UPI003EBB2A86